MNEEKSNWRAGKIKCLECDYWEMCIDNEIDEETLDDFRAKYRIHKQKFPNTCNNCEQHVEEATKNCFKCNLWLCKDCFKQSTHMNKRCLTTQKAIIAVTKQLCNKKNIIGPAKIITKFLD